MRTIVIGFVAGVLSELIFHKLGWYISNQLGLSTVALYSGEPVLPFGVPAVVSQALWGGLWGIAAMFFVPRLPSGLDGVLGWILFIALIETVVHWFIVVPIKGLPVGNGFPMPGVVVAPIVNGFWGFGMWQIASLIGRAAKKPTVGVKEIGHADGS
jgi:hypothetical protein